MNEHPTWAFLSGLGVLFSLGFVGLTTTWAYLVLRLRERSTDALIAAGALSAPVDDESESWPAYALQPSWAQLVEMRAGLIADADRAAMVAGSVPVLALLGTVLGFFFALGQTGQAGLGASDPLAILKVMLDSGMDTALATTVAGQALYLLMSLAYAAFVTGPVERADITLKETIDRARGPSGAPSP